MAMRGAAPKQAAAPLGDQLFVLFDELLRSRNRLAGLPALTRHDVETASQAMHEVVWYFLTPPKGRRTELPLPEGDKAELMTSAGNRAADLYTLAVACVAFKLHGSSRVPSPEAALDELNEFLDALAFDFRMPKRRALDLLSRARKEVDARAAYLRASPATGYRFAHPPERYENRKSKGEKPDTFFRRVYGAEVKRGLTQADLRRADPKFYNVLHVWCARHERRLSSMLPGSRIRGH